MRRSRADFTIKVKERIKVRTWLVSVPSLDLFDKMEGSYMKYQVEGSLEIIWCIPLVL